MYIPTKDGGDYKSTSRAGTTVIAETFKEMWAICMEAKINLDESSITQSSINNKISLIDR